jgi:predicted amidohydrolase YtcJ
MLAATRTLISTISLQIRLSYCRKRLAFPLISFVEKHMKQSVVLSLFLMVPLILGETNPSFGDDSPAPACATLVLRGGKIWTVNQRQPQAEALAIWRDRILAVGSEADVKRLIGPATRVIDLQGRRVLPGFHDSHVHLLSSGLRLSQVALKDAADEAEFGRRLRDFDRKLPPGRWMLGGDWDHDRTFGGKLPTAELLDKYVPDRPAYLHRYDGHMAVVNTIALEKAGITAETLDPGGGIIVRKPGSKEPSGVLRDRAMGLVSALVPPPSEAEILEGVRAALAEAARCGVTSVQDMDGSEPAVRRTLLRVLQQLSRSGKLTLRVRLYFPLSTWRSLAEVAVQVGFGGDWVTIGSLKDFIDGSLGSSTGKMFEPYLNEPGSTGIFLTRLSRLRDDVIGADAAGLGVAVHAIGDRGNAEMLDIFADAIKNNGPRDRRFRIEHAQHVRPQDFHRFAELGVIASMQPYHAIDDGRWAEGRIGKKRCATSYALRSFLDAGVKLAFGSDWNVAPLDAILGIDAAVNRRTLDGKHPEGWFPEQRIPVEAAIEAYTLGSAYAAFQEKDRGTLEPGKLADLVVLSRDILAPSEHDNIARTEVVMTIAGGRIVYQK